MFILSKYAIFLQPDIHLVTRRNFYSIAVSLVPMGITSVENIEPQKFGENKRNKL